MTTYLLSKPDEEIRGKSFVYAIMKKIIGDEQAESAITKIVFTKDKKGLVFDLSSEYDDMIQEKWFNTKSLEMKPITELPEVEQEVSQGGGFRDRRGGGRFGDKGGRFGDRGGDRGGRGFGDRGRGGFGGRGRDGGRDGGRGGGRGGRFGGNGAGDSNKRKFDNASNFGSQNKRIKFDE